MNKPALRLFIRSLIKEAKEKQKIKKEEKLPKSSGKLIDLKKELAALKQMKEELQTAKFAEKTAETEVEFANLQKFAKELDKLKAGGMALESNIDNKIKELETKIDAEKNKIREMIGMTPKGGQKPIEDVKDPGSVTDTNPEDTEMPGLNEEKKSDRKKEDKDKKKNPIINKKKKPEVKKK